MTGQPTTTGLPDSVRLVEVGLRDGLQALPPSLTTAQKVELVRGFVDSGFRTLEVASFAHPRVLPQLADAERLLEQVPRSDSVAYRALVPNLRGAHRAAACELDEWLFVVPTDDDVALRNQGLRVDELLDQLDAVAELARANGAELLVAVACAFFAPASGAVPPAQMMRVVTRAAEVGATGVYLACTSGQEQPLEVGRGVRGVRDAFPELEVGVHLHNRNGFAPANAVAALQSGATWLEAGFAGLGGDAWFPGDPTVLGNMAMEDLVHLCDCLGVASGVDLDRYLDVVHLSEQYTGVPSRSFVTRGGTRDELARASWPEPGGAGT